MNDPKLAGAAILRSTMCKLGTHTWLWGDVTMSYRIDPKSPPTEALCTCGRYKWSEWERIALVSPHSER